jgi:hypothetical protein
MPQSRIRLGEHESLPTDERGLNWCLPRSGFSNRILLLAPRARRICLSIIIAVALFQNYETLKWALVIAQFSSKMQAVNARHTTLTETIYSASRIIRLAWSIMRTAWIESKLYRYEILMFIANQLDTISNKIADCGCGCRRLTGPSQVTCSQWFVTEHFSR